MNSKRVVTIACCVLFEALAVTDSVLLIVGLLRRCLKDGFEFDVNALHASVCKTQRFVDYTLGMISSFLLVTLTLQRATSVLCPYRTNVLFTRGRCLLAVAIIVVCAALLNINLPFSMGLVVRPNSTDIECHFLDKQAEDYVKSVHNYLDVAFTSVIPSLIMIGSNAVIIWKVKQVEKRVHELTEGQNKTNKSSKTSQMTVTLIIVSVAFVLLTLPMTLFYFCTYTIEDEDELDGDLPDSHYVVEAVVFLLYYSNAAVNFYIYCLSGTKFRQELRRLFIGE
nr:hypothetical protein BaRGS_024277 [Batillaria attramentaria]